MNYRCPTCGRERGSLRELREHVAEHAAGRVTPRAALRVVPTGK